MGGNMQLRLRPIPEGSTEIQTGLWLYVNERGFSYLYSSEGYCFYDRTDEIWRMNEETGEPYLVPEDEILPQERTYAQYASLGIYADINNYVSVPVDPSYEIVNTPPKNEIM